MPSAWTSGSGRWSTSGLLYRMDPPRRRGLNRLDLPGRPADDGLLHLRGLAQAEMERALILGRVSAPPRDLLQLLLPVPRQADLRPDGASVGGLAPQIEADPSVLGGDRVFEHEEGAPLVGHDDVQDAAVPEVDEDDGAAVVRVGVAHGLR